MHPLCTIGLHARIPSDDTSNRGRLDLYRCRRCPAQWRIGSYSYSWGVVPYRHRIADATLE